MTVVLVNGNPETSAIWDLLCRELSRRDIVRLSPPGFGARIPPGFDYTITGYRDWLLAELDSFDEPVDLVGHDIGGSTVIFAVIARPDTVMTWVTDSLGVFHPDYVWHELARTWQTKGSGEASVKELLGGTTAEKVERMIGLGINRPIAEQIAPAQRPEMAAAILSFYRSARQPAMAELGHDLPAAGSRPGLAIIGTADQFVGTIEQRVRSAARARATPCILQNVGHWWMVQAPQQTAAALDEFWARAIT